MGDLRGGDPDLLPLQHVVVAEVAGEGLEPGGVQAGVGLGHGEARLLLAADQRRQPALLLLVAAEHHDGVQPEDVHVHGRGAGEARARFADRLHHQRRLGDPEPRAAMLLRHGDAQPAGLRDRGMELVRKTAVAVALEPVLRVEALAQLEDCVANGALLGGEGEIHGGSKASTTMVPGRGESCPIFDSRAAIDSTTAPPSGCEAHTDRCGRRRVCLARYRRARRDAHTRRYGCSNGNTARLIPRAAHEACRGRRDLAADAVAQPFQL